MNKKYIIISFLVIILAIASYMYFNYFKTHNNPPITKDKALELVKNTWGDCKNEQGIWCGRINVDIYKSNNEWYISAIYQGLRDDSVDSLKRTGVLHKTNTDWELGGDTTTQKCQTGRGHQNFSKEPCT